MWHATNYCSDQLNIYYQHDYYCLTYCLQKVVVKQFHKDNATTMSKQKYNTTTVWVCLQ
jgi:hypothetical protein